MKWVIYQKLFILLSFSFGLHLACSTYSDQNKIINHQTRIEGIILLSDGIHYNDVFVDTWPLGCNITDADLKYLSKFLKAYFAYEESKPIKFDFQKKKNKYLKIIQSHPATYVIGYGQVMEKHVILENIEYLEPIDRNYFFSDNFLISKKYCKNFNSTPEVQ